MTLSGLKSGSASRFEVGRCHVADTRRKTKRGVLFELLAATDSEAQSLCLPLSVNVKLQWAV
jgi:hypothetical protein